MQAQNLIIIAGFAAVAATGAFAAHDSMRSPRGANGFTEGSICPKDAYVCPDDTVVGRIPPACDFAPCPRIQEGVLLRTSIDHGGSDLGITVTPHEILEDSRCPVDVQCVWAGTVRVRATLESGLGTAPQIFELYKSITTETEIVHLAAVEPSPYAGVTIKPEDYVFVFLVTKRPHPIEP